MLQMIFSFNEQRVPPPGFDLGSLEIRGELGAATSKERAPIMVILSVVELLDGSRRFLSTSNAKEYRFMGVDSSFCVLFQKAAGKIDIYVGDRLLHVSTPAALKRDIENSVMDFVNTNDVSSMSNEAEANDLRAAIQAFAKFSVA